MEEVFREKDKGVSAIVGTILIVAITVVLAATVYGVLTGFGGLISGGAPNGAISVTSNGNAYTVTFTQLSKNVSLSNVEVKWVTTSGYTGISTPLTSQFTNSSGSGTISLNSYNLSGGLTISSVITINMETSLSSISIIDTSPSGTIATWSS